MTAEAIDTAARPAATMPVASLVLRGEVIEDNLVEVGGRGGDLQFLTPDVGCYLHRLPLSDPGAMADLHELSFEDIVDFLERTGKALARDENGHLARARELSYLTSPVTPSIVDAGYADMATKFEPALVREMAEKMIGIRYLEGWVTEQRQNGLTLGIRCFGARALHIIAGNSPAVAAATIIRNAILRSDAIIKAPSNDPFTAIAIARIMCEMGPGHPLTRHLTVGYWRGGDTAIEEHLYQPHNIEKIVAWGGYASLKHVARYIQPGIDLIALDPKLSASIVGAAAFADETNLQDAAQRLACDIGALNQVGCVNARVVYVQSGTDEDGIARLNRFGQLVYDAMRRLPERISTPAKRYDRELKAHVDALRLADDWFRVIGGEAGEGAVIVSQIPEAVEFSAMLNDRTANLVPVDSLSEMASAVNAYTQTVGIYPEGLKAELMDVLALYGAQRFVSLGFAVQASNAQPQDGLELMRRMGKWVINEVRSADTGTPPWA